jgi:uncharacterized protein YdaU (DUF1376 family)
LTRQRDALDYFRFDVVAWLTSPVVTMMTPTQEGAYIRLLALQWRTKDCMLPAHDAALASLSRLGSDWSVAGKLVREQFVCSDSDPSRVFNKRLRFEWLAAWSNYKARCKANRDNRLGRSRLVDDSSTSGAVKGTQEIRGKGKRTGVPVATAWEANSGGAPATPGTMSEGDRPQEEGAGVRAGALTLARTDPRPWSAEACEDWIERFGGTAPGGEIGRHLKPLLATHGWPEVRKAWRAYLAQVEADYASPRRFANTYGRWVGRAASPARAWPALSARAQERENAMRAMVTGGLKGDGTLGGGAEK